MASDSSDGTLRLLYLDWCSAQVAKRILEMSLDEVWLRSHLAASLPYPSGEARTHEPGSSGAVERIPGYLELVRKTALLLAQEMDLPSFEDWKEQYLKDPRVFDAEMLGR